VSDKPRHSSLWGFTASEDGVLMVGGVPLTELAARLGSTPFFAYDRALMTRRMAELRAALPRGINLHYAMKANPMPDVVRHMSGLVDGIDVASVGEMRVAIAAGMAPTAISFAGPGKTDEEIAEAVEAGITLNMESEREMRVAAEVGKTRGVRPRVAIRVNPDFELKSSGMRMSGGPKPFGVDAERVPAMLEELASMPLEFMGFHIFSGSQNLNADSLRDAQEKTVDLAIELAKAAPVPVRKLNIGGGFGIPYFPGDRPLDIAAVGEGLTALLPRVKAALPEAGVIIELGRYLVGEAGIYVSRVVDRKLSRGELFLITDGGLHHQLAASGNFGTVVRRNYPLAIATRLDSAPEEEANVVGCLCTPLDRLADQAMLPRAEIGDLVAVFCAGAYGATASPAAFLGHGPARELLV
jgi:diaminopimelate decarboxylase